jgi:hypothetical protein
MPGPFHGGAGILPAFSNAGQAGSPRHNFDTLREIGAKGFGASLDFHLWFFSAKI